MKRRNVKHIVVKLFESNSCSWPYSIRSFSSFDRFYIFFPLFYCIYFIIMNTTRHGVDGCGDVAVSILDVCCFFLFFFALWLWQSHWTCTLYTLHLVSCLFVSLSLPWRSCSVFLALVPSSLCDSWEFFVCLLRFFYTFFFGCEHTFPLCFQSIIWRSQKNKKRWKEMKREEHDQTATTQQIKRFWEE